MAENKDNDLPFNDVEDNKTEEQVNEVVNNVKDESEEPEIKEEEVIANLEQLQNLVGIYPEYAETDEYKELLKSLKEQEEDKGGESEEKEEVDDDKGGKSSKSKNKKNKKDEKEEDGEEDGEEDDEEDIFGIKKSKNKKKVKIDFEVPDDLKKFLEKKYSINDFDKFVNSVDTWRNQAQEYSQYAEKYEEIIEGLQELPIEIKEAIDAYANGKDYIEAFKEKTQRLDFNLPFEKQEKDKVVKHYFSSQYEKMKTRKEKGEIDDAEYDELIDALYESSKTLFQTEKEKFDSQRAELIEREKKMIKARKNSVSESVDYLLEKFPGFSKAKLQSIKQRLTDGNIENLFFDKDGRVKKDAAEKIALALYGETIIKNITNKAKKDGITEANEKVVSKGSKNPKASKTQENPTNKQAEQALSHLSGLIEEDPYS